eukprot:SAG31_NODE_56_length_29726_cov_41.443312_16_plen_225_part_00
MALENGHQCGDAHGGVGCDVVTVFDGPTTSSPVLGTFSGTQIPPPLMSTSNTMTVRFETDTGNFAEPDGGCTRMQRNYFLAPLLRHSCHPPHQLAPYDLAFCVCVCVWLLQTVATQVTITDRQSTEQMYLRTNKKTNDLLQASTQTGISMITWSRMGMAFAPRPPSTLHHKAQSTTMRALALTALQTPSNAGQVLVMLAMRTTHTATQRFMPLKLNRFGLPSPR